MKKIKTIIWDWNGTLLDDVDVNICVVNKMLADSNIKTISKEYYRSVFTFPIFDFYNNLGFKVNNNPSLFKDLVKKYNILYREHLYSGSLFPNVKHTLQYLKELGINHIILSGQNQQDLDYQVDFFNIRNYFQIVRGSEKEDASDKKQHLYNILNCQNLSYQEIMIIGDTVFDWKLASDCGISCILFSHGHQNEQTLSLTPAKVFPYLSQEFFDYLLPILD